MEDDEDEASTKASILKTHLIRETPALASPDLLSDVSDMKQDLIKMTAILTTDTLDKSSPINENELEKGVEDVSGEPLEIMEKVKEDLEKVSEILRSGTYEGVETPVKAACRQYKKDEEWVLLSDCEIEEAKMMAAFETQEVLLKDIRGSRGSQAQKRANEKQGKNTVEGPSVMGSKSQESGKQEKFTEVVLRKGGKKIVPTVLKDIKSQSAEVKKPVRRKGPQGHTDDKTEETHKEELLSAPTHQKGPISPVVEETPIGSIKDKVKALQKKVEDEQRGHKQTGIKPPLKSSERKPSAGNKDQKTPSAAKLQTSQKSQKKESERLEETMSVKELMSAFQKGQDPSKRKSGLFEHKTPSEPKQTKNVQVQESQGPVQSEMVGQGILKASKESQPDRGPFQHSSDGVQNKTHSHCDSHGEEEVHISSEESDKHEGMADTPETSPESLSLLPKQPAESILVKLSKTVAGTTKAHSSKVSGCAETFESVSVKTVVDESIKNESVSYSHDKTATFSGKKLFVDEDNILASSSASKSRKLTKRGSETIESFLSDDESPDGQLTPTITDNSTPRTEKHKGLILPLRHQDCNNPIADDSITISHHDSLEGSPVREDNSSRKSPDSIEPSPIKDSPCRDSLENSPVEQKHTMAFLPAVVTTVYSTSSKAPELPSENVHCRLLKDQDCSVDDDSCKQTSHPTSSGKSPVSPDTPSSEEVSYEINPKSPDPLFLSMSVIPVIPEDTEEDLTYVMSQAKFTPEEEMFKMAAKIKTFDEMAQDAKDKMDIKKDISPQAVIVSEEGHKITTPIDLAYKVKTSSVVCLAPTELKQGSEVKQSIEPSIKVQPPSPFPAGEHASPQTAEDIQQTMAHTSASADESMGGLQSVSESHTANKFPNEIKENNKSISITKLDHINKADFNKDGEVDVSNKLKEENEKKTKESIDSNRSGQHRGVSNQFKVDNKAFSRTEYNTPDQVIGDCMSHSKESDLPLSKECTLPGKSDETLKSDICVSKASVSEETPPKTKSRGVTAKAVTESWNAVREDDAAFAARVKEEEQMILGLMVDRPGQGATPDTTPGRTPTEEGTPTSEQNPFLFQEGKLFEMTRSGAIDMTKRGYEEEGFAFFHIGEQPFEEAVAEDIREELALDSSGTDRDVAINPTVQNKSDIGEHSLIEATSLFTPPDDDQSGKASLLDATKSRIPIKMGVSASPKTNKNQTTNQAVAFKTDKIAENNTLATPLSSAQTELTEVQKLSTVNITTVYSQQQQESLDFSPDQHSIKELPQPLKNTQISKKMAKPKSQSTSKNHIASTQKKFSSKEEEKLKSRIPIKGNPAKSETEHVSMKQAEPNKDKKSKLPVKPTTRRKSETDSGPSVSSRVTRSVKAKSFCESDSTKKPAKKDQGRPASTDFSNKNKTLPSKLPVRGKPGQPTGKKEQPPERCKKPVDFFEEISDEAAKLVKQLAQARKEKEEAAAMSDDESSAIDVSVIESEPFPDMQMPLPEDPLVIRPRWDDPVETQMERIPADKVQSQGIPIIRGPFSLSSASAQ